MGLYDMAERDEIASVEMSVFAKWFLRAADRTGQSTSRIAERAGFDRSYLHKITNSHKPEYKYYKRPSYDKTLAIGEAVGDVAGAMEAAGRLKEYRERQGEHLQQSSSPDAEKVLVVIKNLLGNLDDPLSRIGREIDPKQFTSLPFATGKVSAGPALLNDAETESGRGGDVISGDVRMIQVDGDCMEPFYRHGDILFVKHADSAENGEFVVAVLNGETVACKIYRQTDEGSFLEATNGKYPKITGDFRIAGIVKGSYRP